MTSPGVAVGAGQSVMMDWAFPENRAPRIVFIVPIGAGKDWLIRGLCELWD
jgi:hypothetical protein